MRIVVTIVGKDRVGIIARASNVLAEHNINILNINQNIMDGFFNMVLLPIWKKPICSLIN